ncbi:hypothetical protein V1520DRAFT_93947 [Lipomyces starkeyi]|uniref:Retrotransposon gag domain-containing protein n=1 Tax=Lipomyces starkeyi NRRL Y-11557 TaxID=675824 RepID=A0A1E3PXN8_LIPST|nr:hypothetical protein LIPSTDRAFT_173730 [Lipomyces starkeyi NRRL Y-11557]
MNPNSRRAALLALKQKHTDDLNDHITEFEILCSQVLWPDETKASLFLETLSLGLKSSIRRSDVDLESYEKVKQKAQRMEREFQNTTKQRATQKTGQNEVRTVSNPDFRVDYLKKGLCFNCGNKGIWQGPAQSLSGIPLRQLSRSLQWSFLLISSVTLRKTPSPTDRLRRGCGRHCIFGGNKDTE